MASITAEPIAPSTTQPQRGWLVSPWFDALFIANVAWPLLLFVQFGEGFAGRSGIEFWQIYFVTTPHRWITMFIVFLDRERLGERWLIFLGIAVVAIVLCVSVRITTGALTCLMTIDYLWNAWHFASQHHGIYRVYDRMSEPQRTHGLFLEKWAMRGFLLYVIVRVATATWADADLEAQFRIADLAVLIIPAWLVLREVRRSQAAGRILYLLSVMGLYCALLWSVRDRRLGLMLILTTASALFHAIEYLALVSWSVRQRHEAKGERMGMLGYLAPRWGVMLVGFMVVLGAGAWFMQNSELLQVWLLINVIVAFLHYAYDGLIWRRRRTA